ncbi:hypothetical protein EYS10_05015 [Rahnella aquatilis]|nr:hypothetical protein EYS10_05015 [Rahnella aquatilis]
MASAYTGLYVTRLSDGSISGVQVVDSAGNEQPLDAEEYETRRIQPPIDRLPEKKAYFDNLKRP